MLTTSKLLSKLNFASLLRKSFHFSTMDAAPPPKILNLADQRISYDIPSLQLADLSPSPYQEFIKWYDLAKDHERYSEWQSMAFATCTPEGLPSLRLIILAYHDEKGFNFFTHSTSQKGQQMETNPNVAGTFYWPVLYRQVRLVGKVEKLTAEESDNFWSTRRPGARAHIICSDQTSVIEDKEASIKKVRDFVKLI